MKLKPSLLLALVLIGATSLPATDFRSWRLGEDDSGAAAGGAGAATTVDAVAAKNLTLSGSATYSSDVPAGGSALSMQFGGAGNYTGASSGFYTGVDLTDFQLSFDAKPTSAPSFHIAVCLGRYGANQCAFIYYTAGVWHYHVNGSGDKITGAGTTGAWQHIVLTRQSGTVKLYINGSLAGSSTSFVSPTDDFTIAAGKKGDGSVEGRFIGLIDNVKLSTVPPPDADGDGLPDAWETLHSLDPNDDGTVDPNNGASGDPDSDGATNLQEFTAGSDPRNILSTPSDTDADGLLDTWETTHFTNLAQTGSGDPDGDFSTNEDEETAATDPMDKTSWPDDDADFLGDGWEVHYFRSSPGETLWDILVKYGRFDDPDSDGFDNLAEQEAGSDPTLASSTPDSDADGLVDAWEVLYFRESPGETVGDIVAKYDGTDDPDADGADNAREYLFGTNPADNSSTPPAPIPHEEHWVLGEYDSGAADGGALQATTIALGGKNLGRVGTGGTYSAEVPAGGSALSASFTGSQNYAVSGSGIFSGMDYENFEVLADVRPTGNVSGFSVAVALGRGGQGSIFLYHTGDGSAWNVHSNGVGNIITGGTATFNTWQHLRLARTNGVLRFYVNNVEVGSSTTQFTSTGALGDTMAIGAHFMQSGIYEGRFQGQIDNVVLVTPPPPLLDADSDGLLDSWETAHGLSIASGTGTDGPEGDPDGDGASNLREFALGGDPQAADGGGASVSRIANVGGADHLVLTFACRSGATFTSGGPITASLDGITYTVRGSGDLSAFLLGVSEVVPALTAGLPPTPPSGYEYRTFGLTSDVASQPEGFLQVRVSAP